MRACTTMSAMPTSSSSVSSPFTNKQLMKFSHKNRTVHLVGTMHYNGASIDLAAKTVKDLADTGTLSAVVLETCERRWAKTLAFQPPGSFARALLDNEFQSAQEAAGDASIVLGDQGIADLGASLQALTKSTLKDFLSPSGWKSYVEEVRAAVDSELAPLPGVGIAHPGELFDAKLLLNLPVSLVRYPLAWLLKSPKLIVPLVSFFYGISILPTAVESIQDAETMSMAEDFVTDLFLVLDILQITILTRCFLVALLRDRNDILANSISKACEDAEEGESVVAILGAAHLNGVQRRLYEGQ